MTAVSRFPLAWPAGWARTPSHRRKRGMFSVSFDKAVSALAHEIELLEGHYPVLSTNFEVRLDGTLKRDAREPADPGAAVYFELGGRQKVFACDAYSAVRDNVRALSLTMAAMRSIARYGASQMLERALESFEALPAPLDPWQVLGIVREASRDDIDAAFRRLALKHHPDHGGSTAKMAELNRARDLALAFKENAN